MSAQIIQGTAIKIKEYQGKRVVTFKDIDTVHKRREGTASRNFNQNRNRFIEDVDFFKIKITDNEIRSQFGISPNAGGTVMLITETGYLMLVKYSRMFNDNELLWLLNEIIDSIETAEIEDLTAIYLLEEDIDPETGIPIGNYLSQYSGNYYFSSFDHWIKEQKHVKYYFRYMDDMVIFGKTKEELFALKKEIDIYFRNELKLNIKENWQVFPSYVRGVDFLGYRTFYKYTLLRKSTCLEMEKKMTAIRNKVEAGNMMNYSEWCSINSYKGWLKYADTFRLYQKYVVPLLPYADDYYIRNIKPNTKKGLNVA